MKFCPQCEHEYDDSVELCPLDGNRLVKLHVDTDNLLGRTVDERFQVVDKIGEGGMGTVYLAVQRPIGRKVAFKVLSRSLAADDDAVKRFFHEAKVVSKLRHPNTITLYDFGQSSEGLLYIAMEYMTGESLDQFAHHNQLTLRDVTEIVHQVLESLSEAHQNSIIHRDLKPENIFIDRVGSQNIVKVLDFGIAKIQGSSSNLTLTGMVFGTPAYMSPEQSQGFKLDQRSDLYSLGVVLFELVCGHLPYEGDTAMKVAMAHILEPIPDPALHSVYQPLPPGLTRLITDLLAKDKEDRPADADEVLSRLRIIERELDDQPQSASLTPNTGDDAAVTLLLGAVDASSSHRLAVREHPSQLTPSGGRSRPSATGPHRSGELFDTANYHKYATARYSEGEQAEERAVPPEILEAQARRWGYWATVGLALLSALVLLMLFGPRSRKELEYRGGMSDYGPTVQQGQTPGFPSRTSFGQVVRAPLREVPPSAFQRLQAGSPQDTIPPPAGLHEGSGPPSSTALPIGSSPPPTQASVPPSEPPPTLPAEIPVEPAEILSPPEEHLQAPIATEPPGMAPPQPQADQAEPEPPSPDQAQPIAPPPPPVVESPIGAENPPPDRSTAEIAPPVSPTVTVSFRTTPSRARILWADSRREVCQTTETNPCQAEIPYGQDEVRLKVVRRNCETQELVFIPDHPDTYHIILPRISPRETTLSSSSTAPPMDGQLQPGTPPPDEGTGTGRLQLMGPVTFESPAREEVEPVD
ncbi:MAG: protein kinase [Bradymonadales bacterium]|nr:protein kinase [Bradymonadales bacterium]